MDTERTKNAQNHEPRPTKGDASRATILVAAAQLATTRGLAGLSIGDLAAHVGMSKSGLYAHFKSKEELELATIETAAGIFEREVLQPAAAAAPGLERLRAIVDAFLSHLERRVFPGGCFFAAVTSELDTRPGPARDSVRAMFQNWQALFAQCIRDAQAVGQIAPDVDVSQTVFEVQAMLLAGNFQFVLTDDPHRLSVARAGVEHALARVAVNTEPKMKRSARRSR